MQGWIRDADRDFGKANCGEGLGESYAWCTVFLWNKVIHLMNWTCEVENMGIKSRSCSQHVVEIWSWFGCLYNELGVQFNEIGRTYC